MQSSTSLTPRQHEGFPSFTRIRKNTKIHKTFLQFSFAILGSWVFFTALKENNENPMLRDVPYSALQFLIENTDFCRRRPNMEFITYVHSSISRVENRRITRETWANVTSYDKGIDMGVLFVVGRPQNETEVKIVLEENEKFGDILQVDLDEDYHLLSYKGLASLSWINNHCGQVPWTIHADDDILVDVFLLAINLRSYNVDETDQFYCNIMYSKVLKAGKWAVEDQQLSGSEYPIFCSGLMWALPTHVIPRLLKASLEVPILWVDDVYVTGLLAKRANISHQGDPDGYGSDVIRSQDIGLYHAWHSLKGDRRYWWAKIARKSKTYIR